MIQKNKYDVNKFGPRKFLFVLTFLSLIITAVLSSESATASNIEFISASRVTGTNENKENCIAIGISELNYIKDCDGRVSLFVSWLMLREDLLKICDGIDPKTLEALQAAVDSKRNLPNNSKIDLDTVVVIEKSLAKINSPCTGNTVETNNSIQSNTAKKAKEKSADNKTNNNEVCTLDNDQLIALKELLPIFTQGNLGKITYADIEKLSDFIEALSGNGKLGLSISKSPTIGESTGNASDQKSSPTIENTFYEMAFFKKTSLYLKDGIIKKAKDRKRSAECSQYRFVFETGFKSSFINAYPPETRVPGQSGSTSKPGPGSRNSR